MNADAVLPLAPSSPLEVNPDLIFATLGDPARRRILISLANGVPKTVTELVPAARKKFDATRKHLVALRESGLVTMNPDPADSRRQRYALHPGIVIDNTQTVRTLDFGCCLIRYQPGS